jgi:hypothetical protein
MYRSSVLPAALVALLAVTSSLSQARARPAALPTSERYSYQGVRYDRLYSVLARPRSLGPAARRSSVASATGLAGVPYQITDLASLIPALYAQNPTTYSVPTGVSNTGHIVAYIPCQCFYFVEGDEYGGGFSGAFDDVGHVYNVMTPYVAGDSAGTMIAYAVSNVGSEAGQWTEQSWFPYSGDIEWTDSGVGSYTDGHDPGDTALAMNDANVSVGQDRATLASDFAAAAFSFTRSRVQLKSLKSCTIPAAAPPMATGINDDGTIVGYACDRAVEFSMTKYAAVLPVGASGVSSAAQAINVHGYVVGSVGNQAFLYRGRLTRTYLPRPPGESAGNAVAYAINGSDEIVGDIVTATGSTAFLYANGESYDLNSLLPANSALQIFHASGINDSGQIVGEAYYTGPNGGSTGFSMKPHLAALR